MNQFAAKFKQCSKLNDLESLYAFMIKNNKTQDSFLVNQFICACSSLRCTELAAAIFHELKDPNIYIYNAIIGSLLRFSHPVKALRMYMDMLKTEVRPTSFTFSSVTKSCTVLSDLNSGNCIHGQIWKYGFESHLHVQTALIDFYSNSGRIGEARRVFDTIGERDGFAWTTMVSSYVRAGDMSSATKLFDEIPEPSTASWNAIINGFARIGNVESAKMFFDKMPLKDLISWTTMINCYSQNRCYKEALESFNKMKDEGIKPDEITMSTIISACAHLGWLNIGKDIHIYLMHAKFDLDVYIGSALVDMYAKCGDMERSLVVFYKLREKNLFCWNSVIEGFAAHGHAKEALAMFHMMMKEKLKPNGVTFISVLSACNHAGLVEDGRSIFTRMTREFSIVPEMKHYGCMVDLLCKAGLLEEALELVGSMRTEPSLVIWGSLLTGCKLHKNLEIAQLVVDKLTVLEPNNSGYRNLLLNMYAEANQWGEVAKIRANMKNLGVEKQCPGSSWIELDKKIFQFAASEDCLPASKEIYWLLDVLAAQLKFTYTPEFNLIC
ncbi:OLC1v1006001C1 [Oldenlandia corymbosa var. corymbosa]|uniref:OLC1v1006001C1 n=1 Tax=Oldenlandia corymbosa var. corymbosa TaxID=529605 RepID=A0AAV1DJD1_OLDCO|nr:OLC1v1006001C1 [Oldenlandia corymbosa var. corymbosa]